MFCGNHEPDNIVLLWSVDGSEIGGLFTDLHMKDWDKNRNYKIEIQCVRKKNIEDI